MTDYAALARLGVATIHEAAGRTGIVDVPLTQVVAGSRVAGPARIALCAPGDNTMVHAAVAHASPGDVLVLTSAEPAPVALVGELLATQAQVHGVAGILVDGAVRDLDELAAIGLPIWTRFVRAQGATKGVVGKLRRAGGRRRRGDPAGRLVVMDCDGAMALPSERVDEVLPLALERPSTSARCGSGTRPASSPTTCRGSARSWTADGRRSAGPRRGRWQDRRRSRCGGLHRPWLGSGPPGRRNRQRRQRSGAVRGADVVLSLNSAAVALAAAARVVDELGGDTLYADLNTASPQLKRELAAALPVQFADVALVGVVPSSAWRHPRSRPEPAPSASPSSSGRSGCRSTWSARVRATPPA